jgi:ribokinase
VDVVAAGGCTVDIVYAADGRTRGRQLGGNAIYAAAGASTWQLRTGIVAFRGTGLPEGWDELLAALQIDMAGLIPVGVPASVTEFFYNADGERTQRVWSRDDSGATVPYLPVETGEPIRKLRLSAEHLPEHYRHARGAHVGPTHADAQRALVKAFAPIGVLTLDPYPHLMAEATDDELGLLLEHVTAFLPSHEEVRVRYPDLATEEALDRIALFARVGTVIKLGRQGALLYDRPTGRRHVIPAVPVAVIDPTGAGDAFCGGVLAGLVEACSLLEAVARGAVSASFAVEDFGLSAILRATPGERDRRLRWVLERVQ